MKAYSDFNGTLPDGVQLAVESNLVRLFFDFTKTEVESEGEKREQMVCESIDVNSRTYEGIVSAIIVDHYPTDKKDAILANYEEAKDEGSELTAEKRAEYLKEYADFQAWRKHSKEIAKDVLTKL